MATTPARQRVTFPDLSSRAYEHPSDRAALTALRAIPGFDRVLRALSGAFGERRLRLLALATAVRVGEHQMPQLHAAAADAARILDLEAMPELYVINDPMPNAFTLGIDTPFISVTTGSLDLFDEEELRFVIGHEMGHVLSGHSLYSSMLYILLGATTAASGIPLGALGLQAIISALMEWSRKAEESCDRAGLLVGQDPQAALRTFMKMAGGVRGAEMDVQSFLQQAVDYDAVPDVRDSILKLMTLRMASHPFAAPRAASLRRWIDDGAYAAILAGDYPRRSDDSSASFTDDVKDAGKSYKDNLSRSADPLAKFLNRLTDAAGKMSENLRRGGPGNSEG